MDERITAHDGRMTAGRKGVPYDWRGVLADHELEAMLVAGSSVGASVGTSVGASVGTSTDLLGHR